MWETGRHGTRRDVALARVQTRLRGGCVLADRSRQDLWKASAIDLARMIFDEMPERDLVSSNVMLAEYVASRKLFDEIPTRDLVSWNTMIYGYANIGSLGAAREIFDRANERDALSWTCMIPAYAQSRRPNEALRLFHEMQLANVVPDEVTMVSVLSACSDIGALGMGKAMHKPIERNRIKVDLLWLTCMPSVMILRTR